MSAARTEFAMEFARCWECGDYATDIHEIVRGASRNAGYQDRCCWIRTCRRCHDSKFGDISVLPIAKQLALKKRYDPEYYNREMVNLMRGRDKNAITESEVQQHAVT